MPQYSLRPEPADPFEPVAPEALAEPPALPPDELDEPAPLLPIPPDEPVPPLPVPLLFVSAFAAPVSVADDAGAAVLPAELTVLLFPPNMFLRLSLTMSVTVLAAPHIDPDLLPAPVVPPPPPPPVPFPVPVFFRWFSARFSCSCCSESLPSCSPPDYIFVDIPYSIGYNVSVDDKGVHIYES